MSFVTTGKRGGERHFVDMILIDQAVGVLLWKAKVDVRWFLKFETEKSIFLVLISGISDMYMSSVEYCLSSLLLALPFCLACYVLLWYCNHT
jgi:hypothetical protein